GQLRLLPVPARGGSDEAPEDRREDVAVHGTALRVLGSLRGLRRDALRQAPDPARGRSAPDRQRHRLLLDLRRQPSHHTLLPPTPYSTNREGRGPAWSNSLFEDNAEFGLGFRLALDSQRQEARRLLAALAGSVGETLAHRILESGQANEAEIAAQRERVREL